MIMVLNLLLSFFLLVSCFVVTLSIIVKACDIGDEKYRGSIDSQENMLIGYSLVTMFLTHPNCAHDTID